MSHWMAAAEAWVNVALVVVQYVLVPLGVLVGCFVYVRRSPHVNFGIAAQYEREGRLDRALQYYRRAAHYGEGRLEGKLARRRMAEVEAALHGGPDEKGPPDPS
jgi:hypothetical protein